MHLSTYRSILVVVGPEKKRTNASHISHNNTQHHNSNTYFLEIAFFTFQIALFVHTFPGCILSEQGYWIRSLFLSYHGSSLSNFCAMFFGPEMPEVLWPLGEGPQSVGFLRCFPNFIRTTTPTGLPPTPSGLSQRTY